MASAAAKKGPKQTNKKENGKNSGRKCPTSNTLDSLPSTVIQGQTDALPVVPAVTGISFVGHVNPKSNAHLANYMPPSDRPVRIYCDGIYDMFHYGHARSLEQVKKLFPNVHLLVGVCNDELTNSKKGRTVMNEKERAESLRHCRWVDEVVEDAPWVIDDAFLAKHRVDFVAHDDIPYQSEDSDDVYKFVKDRGQFIATQRTAGISTSDLITRIVRDYDQYVRRNIKRGATPRELNLSLLKQGELKVEQLTDRLQERFKEEERNVKNNWESSRDELKAMLIQWEARSQDFIKDFSNLFDFNKILSRLRRKRDRRSSKATSVEEVGSLVSKRDPPTPKTTTLVAHGKVEKVGAPTSIRGKIMAALKLTPRHKN